MSVGADILQRFFRLLFSTVIRMFLRQGRSKVHGVFEVGRPRLNDYVWLGEPFFIKLPVAYFLLYHFFGVFFLQPTASANLAGGTSAKAIREGAYDLEFQGPVQTTMSVWANLLYPVPVEIRLRSHCVCVFFFFLEPRSVITMNKKNLKKENQKKTA